MCFHNFCISTYLVTQCTRSMQKKIVNGKENKNKNRPNCALNTRDHKLNMTKLMKK